MTTESNQPETSRSVDPTTGVPAGDPVLAVVPDSELLTRLERLVEKWRGLDADLVAHIGEVERRGLHRDRGYSSMFAYVTCALGLSAGAAYRRITAARLSNRQPQLLEYLAAGELTISTVCELAPHQDEEDIGDLIEDARGRSKREVQLLLSERGPKRSIAPRIRPLGSGRFAVELNVTAQFKSKLEDAQALLRHAHPEGDPAVVLERALDVLLVSLQRRRFGQTESPRETTAAAPSTRYIPASIRREVVDRDGGQCTFVSESGHRCEERGFLEFDHEEPFCREGAATADGIRLLCHAHNQLEAERKLGKEFMRRKASSRRRESSGEDDPP